MSLCVAGDATTEAPYREALGGRKASLLLTDPPYCLLTRRRKGGDLRDPKGRKIDRDPVVRFESVREYRAFTEGWLPKAIRSLEPDAPCVLWTNFLGKAPLLEVASAEGFQLQGEFVWAKRTTENNGSEQLLRVYEVALVLTRTPLPALAPGDPPRCWAVAAGYDDDGEAARWGSHPHHKPFGVLEPLIRAYSREGGLILEPFAGSGSIPAAALRLNRQVACIELKPEWAESVNSRLKASAST
jgi:site-specific DNA-methyltransferase (adenine-specific)